MSTSRRLSSVSEAELHDLIRDAVAAAVEIALAPWLVRLKQPEPAVYTVAQAARVLQVSAATIRGLVVSGHLAKVPAMGRTVLIPRASLDLFASGDGAVADAVTPTPATTRGRGGRAAGAARRPD